MGTIIDKLNQLLSTKAAIRNAIIEKGQPVPETAPFSTYSEKIAAIQTGQIGEDTSDATATAEDILSGKTAYVKNGKVTGTIPNKTESDIAVAGPTVTTPAGYYSSNVSKSVDETTPATPTIYVDTNGLITANVSQNPGYIRTRDVKSVTKQLATQEAKTVTPGTAVKTAVEAERYTTGAVQVAGDVNLVAENIRSGKSIFGVVGTLEPGAIGSDTSDATAKAEDILSGVTAYSKGVKITGTIPRIKGGVVPPGAQPVTAVQNGVYTDGAVIVAGDSNLKAENIKDGVSIFGVEGTLQSGVDTSDATAASSDILSGKTAYVDGKKITGTIIKKTESDVTISGPIMTVPAGYYSSNISKSVDETTLSEPLISVDELGMISASISQDPGYIKNQSVKSSTKQLVIQAEKMVMPSTSEQVAVDAKRYTTGIITVAGDTNLKAGNIKNGVSIFGVTGNYKGSGGSSGDSGVSSSNVTVDIIGSGGLGGITLNSTLIVYPSSEESFDILSDSSGSFETFGAFYLQATSRTLNIDILINGGIYYTLSSVNITNSKEKKYLVLPTSSDVTISIGFVKDGEVIG